ncbi:transposase [Secundilactobacillus oryzae JCM 18671]|uniref:Transposase n=1 Tax=Secundilactobacillus oryzae JCM 18671 TaxID=1291743 RepID=A0A081BKJ7_9LACO|nr:transposase [Secundilactobacillus oryzae JCM 18671]
MKASVRYVPRPFYSKVLLQIKDPNITDLVVQEATNGSLQVLAKPMYPVTVCARCGKRSMVKNGFISEFLELANRPSFLT